MRMILISCLVFLVGCRFSEDPKIMGYVDADYLYLSNAQGGNVEALFVHEGEAVSAGAKLMALEATPLEQAYNRAMAREKAKIAALHHAKSGKRQTVISMSEATMLAAKTRYHLAEKNYQRMKTLIAKHAITRHQMDIAESQYLEAKATLKHTQLNAKLQTLPNEQDVVAQHEAALTDANAQVAEAKWHQEKQTLNSPAKGWVTKIFYRPGEFSPAGYPMLEMLVPEYEYVVFYVPSSSLETWSLGQKIQVQAGTHTAKAIIKSIGKRAEYTPPVIYSEQQNARLVFKVKAKIEAEDATWLHPGLPVQINVASS